jgi:solute:Na+ symporter, SSS family
MHWIDWLIMTLPLMICGFIAVYTPRYVRSVADFLAGGRGAGRFLICTARSELGSGAASFVSSFQAFIVSGFTLTWWGQISVPVGLLVMVTGFVIYRYRQTRAMTLGQFFEMRYSRNFRLFAGILGFVAGVINFGIIPAVGARFMVAFLGFPQSLHLFDIGTHNLIVPTYLLLMFLFLSVCVVMTTTAGQVSVLLTDCAEGMFSQIFYIFIAIALLLLVFKWSATRAVLLDTKPGESLVNPFDSMGHKDFNLWFALIYIFGNIYRSIAWQNAHAFNSSAATPHESRMGGILGKWRSFAGTMMVTLLSVCALTFLKTHPAEIEAALSKIHDPATRDQMRSPIALTMMLPAGVRGMLLAICLMGIIAGDGIHLHSWGSIFIQDIVAPLRKQPLSPERHITLLRLSIVGVASCAFLFGWLVPQIKYVQYWWGITEAIFVSGAGATIIGGLYWSRGTTPAAWTALIVGAVLACCGIGTEFYHERVLHTDFTVTLPVIHSIVFVNIPLIVFLVTLIAIGCYMAVSILTCRVPHNMDKLLHQGRYAVKIDRDPVVEPNIRGNWLYRLLTFGIDEQFSRTDRWITIGITAWSMLWFAIFVIGSLVYWIHPFSNNAWALYWLWTSIYMPLGIGVVTTVWFTIGCWVDVRMFFRRLNEEVVNDHDDGSVNRDDADADLNEFPTIPAAAQAELACRSVN